MPTLFRERHGGHGAEVTPLELFFDLVFVIAVTQVSHALLEHLTWSGALEAAILLSMIWTAWIYTTWIANWLDPQHPLVRIVLLVLMGIGIVMSASLPEAFGERGLVFAAAYVTFQLFRSLLMLWAVRENPALFRNFQRVTVWLTTAGILWIAGGLAEPETRVIIWLIALAVEYLGPAVTFFVPGLGRSDTRDWNIDGAHIAERAGLFVLIALGESILVTGMAFANSVWSVPVIAAMAVSLIGSTAMWWIYFDRAASAAAGTIAASDDPGRIARVAYTYVPLLLIAGIVVVAVGDELVLHHPEGHADLATALVVLGGPAIYLLGAALFKLSVFGVWSPTRFGGVVVLLAMVPLAAMVSPLILSALSTGVLVLVALVEGIFLARSPDHYGSKPQARPQK